MTDQPANAPKVATAAAKLTEAQLEQASGGATGQTAIPGVTKIGTGGVKGYIGGSDDGQSI